MRAELSIDEATLGFAHLNMCRTVLIFLLVFWAYVVTGSTNIPLQTVAALLILSTTAIGAVLLVATRSQWSAAFLCFVPLALFHVGLYLQPAINGDYPAFVYETDSYWFVKANHRLLAGLIGIGLSAFALGLLTVRPALKLSSLAALRENRDFLFERRIYALWGSWLLIASLVLWFLGGVATGGPLFFLMSYGRFLAVTEGGLIGLTYIGIGVGIVLTVQHARSRTSRLALVLFAAFGVAAYPLGLRGEVLMPLVAAVVAYMLFQERRPRWLLLIASVLVIVSIPLAKEVRRLGVGSGVTGVDVGFHPFEGIEELGATARVLNTSMVWHVQGDESLQMGRTYYTFATRILNTVTGGTNVPASQDFGLMNVEIASRVGNIGGSLIGEAHHNFGLLGVILIPWLFGLGIGAAASRASTPRNVAVLGVVILLVMMHVRNTFGPLLIWALVAAVILGLATFSVSYLRSRESV